MGTEGNGSTPTKFSVGLPVPSERVTDSLGGTEAGREFVVRCLERHATGDWGIAPPEWLELNLRYASDRALAANPDEAMVAGLYPVPRHLQVAAPNETLVVATRVARLTEQIGIVGTSVLFLSEFLR